MGFGAHIAVVFLLCCSVVQAQSQGGNANFTIQIVTGGKTTYINSATTGGTVNRTTGGTGGGTTAGGTTAGATNVPKACSEYDVSSELPGVRNQGAYGSCYAYTAADLMSFGLPKSEKSKYVSALSVAISYSRKYESILDPVATTDFSNIEAMNGGRVAKAVTASNTLGVCSEKVAPSWDFSMWDDVYLDFSEAWKKIKQGQGSNVCTDTDSLRNYYRTGVTTTNDTMFFLSGWTLSLKVIEAKWDLISILNVAELRKKYPTITKDELKVKIDYLKQKFIKYEKDSLNQKLENAKTRTNLTEALNELFGCPSNLTNYPIWKKANAPVEDVSLTSAPNPQAKKDLFLNYMNQAVAQKKPVAISYLTNGLISVPSQNHGHHASLIVGRKSVVVNGKAECHYVVRNSWGSSWPGDRLTNLKAKRAFDQKGVALPGHFMVSERDLVEHLTAYTKVPFAE